jgi:hypothetical protein
MLRTLDTLMMLLGQPTNGMKSFTGAPAGIYLVRLMLIWCCVDDTLCPFKVAPRTKRNGVETNEHIAWSPAAQCLPAWQCQRLFEQVWIFKLMIWI